MRYGAPAARSRAPARRRKGRRTPGDPRHGLASSPPMRVCVIYDCLFPYTVGGAERWYRNLAERLAAAGHEVTYLTLTQWEPGEEPRLPGVRVVAVGPRMALYGSAGQERIGPPVRFGLGVLGHQLRHRREYEVVHTGSFPYFSLLAAGLVAPLGGYRLVVDWIELSSADYWREYVGPVGGPTGGRYGSSSPGPTTRRSSWWRTASTGWSSSGRRRRRRPRRSGGSTGPAPSCGRARPPG